jgi:L-cystine uptake protein TcyP (sodium:dicarboxylate symporter family)
MQFNDSIVIPIIIAMVELVKGLGLPKKFSALLSVVLGIAAGIFYLSPQDIKMGIFEGIIYGLTAAGLYSGAKNTYQQMMSSKDNHQ